MRTAFILLVTITILANESGANIRAEWELIYDMKSPFFIIESDGDNLNAAGREGIHVSRTDGNTWHPKNEGLPPQDGPEGSLWYTTARQLLVTDSGAVIAVAGHRGTWMSRDRGESWDEVTMKWKVPQAPGERDFPLGEAISTMTEFDGYLWAMNSNRLCRSRDEGDSWEMLPNPVYGSIANFDNVYDWTELDNTLYAAGGRSFGRWNEAELIWEHLNRGLPIDVAMKELAVNRGRIFASLYVYELGVWLFDQSSETWAPVGPQKTKDVLVYSIVSHGSDLYAGTREGIYRASIPDVQPYGKAAATWGALKTE